MSRHDKMMARCYQSEAAFHAKCARDLNDWKWDSDLAARQSAKARKLMGITDDDQVYA